MKGLAATVDEVGARVHRGVLRYPSETDGWQLGGILNQVADLECDPQSGD